MGCEKTQNAAATLVDLRRSRDSTEQLEFVEMRHSISPAPQHPVNADKLSDLHTKNLPRVLAECASDPLCAAPSMDADVREMKRARRDTFQRKKRREKDDEGKEDVMWWSNKEIVILSIGPEQFSGCF